tara:strand:- start:1668 stop:2051 length:384 start_codon:yes stop_codon:yes gene_type:complete
MKELLFEILTPDGYVKNGFDKKKLQNIMKNTMVVNYEKQNHNLKHIDKTTNVKKFSLYEYPKMNDIVYFIVDISNDCRLSNLADSTIKFLKENIKNKNITFILKNPKNIKLSSEEYSILKEFNYNLI